MTAINIAQDLNERIKGHLERLSFGEEVRWDISLHPTPTQDGNIDLGYLVVLSMRGALLNSRMVQVMHIPISHVEDDKGLSEALSGTLGEMREQKTRELQSPSAGANPPLAGVLS